MADHISNPCAVNPKDRNMIHCFSRSSLYLLVVATRTRSNLKWLSQLTPAAQNRWQFGGKIWCDDTMNGTNIKPLINQIGRCSPGVRDGSVDFKCFFYVFFAILESQESTSVSVTRPEFLDGNSPQPKQKRTSFTMFHPEQPMNHGSNPWFWDSPRFFLLVIQHSEKAAVLGTPSLVVVPGWRWHMKDKRRQQQCEHAKIQNEAVRLGRRKKREHTWLVGGLNPSEKILVNWADYSQYRGK